MASGPDKAMACRYCQTTRVWRMWRKGLREKPTLTPLKDAPARTWWIWAGGDAHPLPSSRRRGTPRNVGGPTVADRVVQAALKLVLEPIFEAGFEPISYGFRPERRAHDAIAEIHHFGTKGYR